MCHGHRSVSPAPIGVTAQRRLRHCEAPGTRRAVRPGSLRPPSDPGLRVPGPGTGRPGGTPSEPGSHGPMTPARARGVDRCEQTVPGVCEPTGEENTSPAVTIQQQTNRYPPFGKRILRTQICVITE